MAQSNTITDYVILKELGKGSFGTCYLVRSLVSNEVAVVKAVPFSQMGPKTQERALREVRIMKALNHPNIVKYFHSFLEDGTLYILMEFVAKGDFDMAKLLIVNAGADVDQPSPKGCSPLLYAARGGFTEIVRFLILRGCAEN